MKKAIISIGLIGILVGLVLWRCEHKLFYKTLKGEEYINEYNGNDLISKGFLKRFNDDHFVKVSMYQEDKNNFLFVMREYNGNLEIIKESVFKDFKKGVYCDSYLNEIIYLECDYYDGKDFVKRSYFKIEDDQLTLLQERYTREFGFFETDEYYIFRYIDETTDLVVNEIYKKENMELLQKTTDIKLYSFLKVEGNKIYTMSDSILYETDFENYTFKEIKTLDFEISNVYTNGIFKTRNGGDGKICITSYSFDDFEKDDEACHRDFDGALKIEFIENVNEFYGRYNLGVTFSSIPWTDSIDFYYSNGKEHKVNIEDLDFDIVAMTDKYILGDFSYVEI